MPVNRQNPQAVAPMNTNTSHNVYSVKFARFQVHKFPTDFCNYIIVYFVLFYHSCKIDL